MTSSTLEQGLIDESYGFTQEIQAAAINLDGFTVRDDFSGMIRDWVRRNLVFWPLITKKEPAEADLVREIREAEPPPTGFFNKNNLSSLIETGTDYSVHDLTDPGQLVKAGGGLIQISHYSRSLYDQQGKPYGDIIAKKTENLILSSCKTLERSLFVGNAANNPLEFNGIERQMAPGHSFTADIRSPANHSPVRKLRSIVRLSVNDEDILRGITHIFTSGLGVQLLEDDTQSKISYTVDDEYNVKPGYRVPGIIAQTGFVPIIVSPYLRDTEGATGSDPDVVHYWLVDMNQISWKGVYPQGGRRTFEPQIFEVSQYKANQYLVEKRLCLFYGTLYVANRGEGVWKLSVSVPNGMVGSIM